jgi:asparagine synthase (glutamine-hydrolysing)
MTSSATYALDPLEVATGLVLGVGPELGLVERSAGSEPPLRALERAVLPALRRAPCLVSFSGGRDSAAVLAVAAAVARREGLPLPIPATNRFPAAATTDESEWQEKVVSHLGLEDWIRLEHTAELDCVGPVATEALLRHGLLWPFNAHFHVPLLRLASGGSLLTGIGGDETLSPSSWSRAMDVLHGRVRPELRDVLRIGMALAPPVLRRRVLRRRLPAPYPWLRPHARRAFADAWAAQGATEPLGWAAHVGWVRRLRYLHVGLGSLRLLAADDDVRIVHPFVDRGFTTALAALPTRERYASRTAATTALFQGLLPEPVLTRASKTVFDEAFWNEPSRAFAAGWNGEGVGHELVDASALAEEWVSPKPDPRSFLLAQAAWLGQQRGSADRVEQALDGARQ